MPATRQTIRVSYRFALSVVHRVDADDREAALLRVRAGESDEPIAVFAVTSAVTKQQQASRTRGLVETRSNFTDDQVLLLHVRQRRSRSAEPSPPTDAVPDRRFSGHPW